MRLPFLERPGESVGNASQSQHSPTPSKLRDSLVMAKLPSTPEVLVVLDTSALFSDSVDKLICLELSNFITEELRALGLHVSWIMPSMVVTERRQQMLNKATDLMGSVEKLERLLDHRLAITTDTLRIHVDEAVRKQMVAHNLVEETLQYDKVNWESIVDSAARKIPPFQPGVKEKGFKDAVILETFVQVAEKSNRDPKRVRVILYTADDLLGASAKQRVSHLKNAGIVTALDELRTQLNAVASHLSQESIANVVAKAATKFFDVVAKTGIYYSDGVADKISKQFPDVIKQKPESFSNVRIKMNYIAPPTFLKKEGQRIFLSSKITREMVAAKAVLRDASAGGSLGILGLQNENPLFRYSVEPKGAAEHGVVNWLSTKSEPATLLGGDWQDIERKGRHIFEVLWHATLTRQGRLTSPQISELRHISSEWDS